MKIKHLLLSFCLSGLLLTSFKEKNKIKVACVGNSITEGVGLPEQEKYPAILQNYLGNKYEVRNFGLSGRTLLKKGDQPYWNETRYQEVLSWRPDIIIVKLGTNDSKPQNWKFRSEFCDDYVAFLKSLKGIAGKPKIYACYPIPVFEDKWGISERVVKNEIIPTIEKAARKTKVKVIDLHTPFLGRNSFTYDGVHPNGEGNALLASVIFRSIK
ncbi:GDSL-type esterase/lipase family protein [Pedobacter sp. SYSU D00535]|uniref:GDSL-type esterase/lipase family protein n=1 Tax=Pedobacter sp. SYSU D00535 TaxID=2810308 RepID=UPI001A9728F3|nr:GDSL-type esterase/lipase family protein [Pedobacter sp. SYSU D00535]